MSYLVWKTKRWIDEETEVLLAVFGLFATLTLQLIGGLA
tara:strand:+ start:561 stop:677 length:117 start_codon:yes stop_codon:yes gene_type:complete